ncbi:hypothetical protein P3X46_000745 [Hevea brasiliensis]|uniref:Uncharacterized protein n=1 Tax=Hevea brasiliensis TaxID=3981 RepID=A0ABQ9NAL9_HEVBR|nr:hypothetical protein P3X46_000745 [Hevea brasiliensis]
MAKTLFHGHSDSLPSRPQLLMSQSDEHICSLRASEVTSPSSTSIAHKLNGLPYLHDYVDKKYLTSRKLAKKAIQKTLINLKGLENKYSFSCTDIITLSVLKSFLSSISGPKTQSKTTHWSLVSKLMLQRRVASKEEENEENEFVMVDDASLIGCKTACKYDNFMLMENVQSHLKNLELCIQNLEDGTQNLFRRMIKTRVSLLSILNLYL